MIICPTWKANKSFQKLQTSVLGLRHKALCSSIWANTWCLYIQATAFQKVSAGKQGSAQDEILHQLGLTLLSYRLCSFNSFFKAAPCFVPAEACPCLTRECIIHGGPQTFISFGVNFTSVVPKLMFCVPGSKLGSIICIPWVRRQQTGDHHSSVKGWSLFV